MSGESADLHSASAPRRAPEVLTAELDGEAVLYHPHTGTAVVLNATATLVWLSLDGAESLESLALRLAQRFGADLDQVRAEVLEVVRGFGQSGLLDGVEPAPGEGDDAAPGRDG